MTAPTQPGAGTQTVERAIALVREIATFGRNGARASDLILRCKMEYPTAHRILKSLVEQEVVRKDSVTRCYFLGQLIYELGLVTEPQLDLRMYCDAMTTGLAEATGDTVFLNVRSRHDVVCVDRKEGSYPVRALMFDVGNRRPLGIGAAGIALLMRYELAEVEDIVRENSVRFSRYGRPNAEQIIGMVRQAKDVGHVVTDDVVVPGVRAVCLPFGDDGCLPACAVSVAAVHARFPRTRVTEMLGIMRSMIDKLQESRSGLRASQQYARQPSKRRVS